MTDRCLVATDASPSPSGGPAWRRALMFVDVYREAGFETHLLALHPGSSPPDPATMTLLREASGSVAVAPSEGAGAAVEALDARWGYRALHIAAASAPTWIGARRSGLRLADGVSALDGRGVLSERAVHTDVFLCVSEDEAERAQSVSARALTATYLRRAARTPARRLSERGVLAGCWVEADEASIAGAQGLFDAIRARGGGAPPGFVLGGPGASKVAAPPTPHPVLAMEPDFSERAFYHGVDIALFPASDGAAREVRNDAATALELGATPLMSSAALTGLAAPWRLPTFGDFREFAEYLFERGRDLRDGGLLSELRARADWTWSGLQGDAATQRAALLATVRAHV